jgi:hypothetical protein
MMVRDIASLFSAEDFALEGRFPAKAVPQQLHG